MSIFSSTINTPVTSLQEAAATIKRYTDENEDLFIQILNMVNAVESCGDWQGKSMSSLQRVTRNNQKRFEEGMRELFQLGDFLQRYAEAMESKDTELKAQIQRI